MKPLSRVILVFLVVMGVAGISWATELPPGIDGELLSLSRETLKPGDGWASYGEGTSGGSQASMENIYLVRTKEELIEALGGDREKNMEDDTPRIIFIEGTIEISEPYETYKDPEFDFNKYLEEYAPEKWGREKEISGPLEEARARSQKNQADDILIYIGSNKTIIGVGKDAKIIGATVKLKNVHNVIIRNITFESPIDYFPQWDPTDGEFGEWNSEYDCVSIEGSRNIWIDHCSFSDGRYLDNEAPTYFGRLFQQHDGLLDITKESDLITISYNVFYNHDKTMLIGSSDSNVSDRGHLRVTLHHNLFENVTQRLPRVRFGEVHVYNNYYKINPHSPYPFDYAWGVGVESKTYAQNNYFDLSWTVPASKIIRRWKGSCIYEEGTVISYPSSQPFYANLLKAHNDVNVDDQLEPSVGWEPTLFLRIDPAMSVPAIVNSEAGAGKL